MAEQVFGGKGRFPYICALGQNFELKAFKNALEKTALVDGPNGKSGNRKWTGTGYSLLPVFHA